MRNLKYYISLLSVVALTSCKDVPRSLMDGGKLFVDATYIGDVIPTEVLTRGGEQAEDPEYTYDEESLRNSTILWISNNEGVVRKYNGLSNVPAGDPLFGGVYLAEAWAGDSVSASWSARYYKADKKFVVDGDVNVDLELTLANVFASVVIDPSIDKVLKDYQVTVSHSRGSITFVGKENRVASFMMPTNHNAGENDSPKEDKLKWKLTGTEITGDYFVKEGTITNVSEGHQYILKFSHNGGVAAVGGAFIGLNLKDLKLITNVNHIVQPPTIQGDKGAPLTTPVIVPMGKRRDNVYVEIGAVGEFTMVELSGSIISDILGDDAESINLVAAGDDRVQFLADNGVKVMPFNEGQDVYDPIKNLSSLKIAFSPDLINTLGDGSHDVQIYVRDSGGGDNSDEHKMRESRATLTILVSGEIVTVIIPNPVDFAKPENGNLTPTSVRLPATLMDETAQFSGLALEYRVQGTENWNRVNPMSRVARAEDDYEFYIDGLQPNTTIEYRTVWTKAGSSDESFSGIQTVTTADNKVQNGGFEDWNTSGKFTVLYDKTPIYWDSGNEGSSTLSKNVTTPESSIKHSGSYSAKLNSQFVGMLGIGKFAAGNAFVGKYLKTDGTDGILGWGRPFYFRPKALKGYVKYNPATVDKYTSNSAPDIVKGQPDKGIIYVALLNGDTSVQGDPNYPEFPVVVKTKSSELNLFKKDESNVIAYGELVLDKATEGNDMIEFTIPLDYYASMQGQEVRYLLLVCSASKGGDYFAGGDGSVMYIDDFEFVY